MAKFLNTQGLSEWIPRIINETERELIIITPFMQLSDKIYNALIEANKRNVETIIVYRENKLSETDRLKLNSIDNLNLFHHPTLHAKCYYNERYLLIASMNLYEYSEKNNREMGVLMHNVNLENPNDSWGNDSDDDVFKEALFEIKSIIKSSEFEKKSRETINEGFEMNILKTEKELKEEFCKKINQVFVHKQFEPYLIGETYQVRCVNYYDKIDVELDYRIILHFDFPRKQLDRIHKEFLPLYDEYMFKGFKFYWNDYGKQKAYLYKDSRDIIWNDNDEKQFQKVKEGITQFMQLLKPIVIEKKSFKS